MSIYMPYKTLKKQCFNKPIINQWFNTTDKERPRIDGEWEQFIIIIEYA